MPFIPYRDRPISIDEGSREVRLPHETDVSLTTCLNALSSGSDGGAAMN